MAFTPLLRLGLLMCLAISVPSRAQDIEEPPEWRAPRRPPKTDRGPSSNDDSEPRTRAEFGRRSKKGVTRRGASETEFEGFIGLGLTGTYSSELSSFNKLYSLRSQFPVEPGITLGVNFDFEPAIAVKGADTSASYGFSASFNYYFQGRNLFGPWLQLGAGFLKSSATLSDGTKIASTVGIGFGSLGWRFEVVRDFNLGAAIGIVGSLASGGASTFLPAGAIDAGLAF